jgi:hypothetical protein
MNELVRMILRRQVACIAAFGAALLAAGQVLAIPVIVPDNGFGTAQMPILGDYISETPLNIVDGLPMGTTVEIDAILFAPTLFDEQAGGSLGGTKSGGGGAPAMQWDLSGTGTLLGFNRTINMPAAPGLATSSSFEVHAEPRTNGDSFQSFDTVMFRMFSQVTGDPDFDLLRFVAGSDFGLPSPGHTTLLENGVNWEVDSYFDLTYRIDFVGKAGGALSGRSGSTTGTVRISLGDPIPDPVIPEPASAILFIVGSTAVCFMTHCRRYRQ